MKRKASKYPVVKWGRLTIGGINTITLRTTKCKADDYLGGSVKPTHRVLRKLIMGLEINVLAKRMPNTVRFLQKVGEKHNITIKRSKTKLIRFNRLAELNSVTGLGENVSYIFWPY